MCGLFEKHKSLPIANALIYVLNPSDSNFILCSSSFFFLTNTHSFISSGITNVDIFDIMRDFIWGIFLKGTLDEEGTNELLDAIISFKNKVEIFSAPTSLLDEIASIVDRFIGNKSLCLNVLRTFDSFINSKRGKMNMKYCFLFIIIALF